MLLAIDTFAGLNGPGWLISTVKSRKPDNAGPHLRERVLTCNALVGSNSALAMATQNTQCQLRLPLCPAYAVANSEVLINSEWAGLQNADFWAAPLIRGRP